MTVATVNDDLDSLAEPFKARAERLVALIASECLPFRVFEARRAFVRSQELFMRGRALKDGVVQIVDRKAVVSNARAGESPHNWGLAVDCILVSDHDFWDDETPPKNPWDTSTPITKLAWDRYGRAVRHCDLSWGGDWVSFKDLPHAELRTWKTLRPSNWKDVALREVQAGR